MAFEFKLPDIGEGLVEGEIVRWLVKVGDTVREDQPIVEVMTDKATVEITSPRAGKIVELRAREGETVKVHSTIVVIDENVAGPANTLVRPLTGPAGPVPTPPPRGQEAVLGEAAARLRHPLAGAPTTMPVGDAFLQPRSAGPMILPPIPSHRVLAAPAVRRWAAERGIDLHQVRGTGPDGRITRGDVESFTVSTTAAAVAGSYETRGGPTEEVPLKGLRKRIAQQMQLAKQRAPHFTYVEEVDMTPVVELRRELKAEAEKRGVSLSFLPFIFKAIIPALKKFPQVNATLDDGRGVIVYKKYYNLGLSVATDDGLTVVVIKDVDRLDLWQIAAEIQRLSTAARARKIKLEELQDSTFTVTSVGNIGGVLATPIINYPEAGILGVFKIRETPVVRDGKVVIRHMTYLAASFDHRLVDGDAAAHVTNEVVQQLAAPRSLF